MRKIYLITLMVLPLALCENPVTPLEKFKSRIFIDAILVANHPFEGVKIQKTVDFATVEKNFQRYTYFYDFSELPLEQRVAGAEAQIITDDTTIILLESVSCPGLYVPDPFSPFVPKPNTRYDLKIVIDSITEISATTLVPGQVEILNPSILVDTTVFGVGDYSVKLGAINAAGYFVGVSREVEFLTEEIAYIIDQTYPSNTWTITVDNCPLIPWNFFRYLFKKTRIIVYAVDLNFYDFHALGPENVFDPTPPIYHLKGENVIGYFGSVSVDSFYVYLKPGENTKYFCTTAEGRPCDCPDNE